MTGFWHWLVAIGLLIVSAPAYLLLGKAFFGGWDGFLESLSYAATPDILSLFRGEYWEDKAHSFKLLLFVVCCIVLVVCEYALVAELLL